jgi:hypothetical protein
VDSLFVNEPAETAYIIGYNGINIPAAVIIVATDGDRKIII